jgi:2-haloalkanoic acid dehalogenase type II
MNYGRFKLLSFDTYGTLIDWETGIIDALAGLRSGVAPTPDDDALLAAFGEIELDIQNRYPTMLYRDILEQVFKGLADRWGVDASDREAKAFGRSVKHWPAFADAPRALALLRRRFHLVTVTNCDRISYMGSNARLEIEWDAIYTAQDIGSYKPAQRNFDYLLEHVRRDFGVLPHEILHVAQSLTHDMVPATRAGLAKIWIDRRHDQPGGGATAEPTEAYALEGQFESMDQFASAVAAESGLTY